MTVASPTPPTAFRVKRTREVDVHARNLDAWDQDYVQTSPGVFQGQVRELFDGPLQAFEEVANCATSQFCRPWQGGVWLGLSVPEHPDGLRFMGRAVSGHELMISDGSEAFDLQAASAVNQAMEVLIREAPGQYLWGYNRYKGPRRAAPAP